MESSRKEYHAKWYQENKAKRKLQSDAWYMANKERKLSTVKQWRLDNKGKVLAKNARRRAARRDRIPEWADLHQIRMIYVHCPEGYEVDHIIPMQGETVSGLHHQHNLQYLTRVENATKGNRHT